MEQLIQTLLVVVIWATSSSWGLDRLKFFEDKISPSGKQLINAIVNFGAPTLVVWLTPYWQTDFGDIGQFGVVVVSILAGAGVWVVSQIAHRIDTGWIKKK